MFKDNHKNQVCEFAEETLSYLYGEFGDGEKTKIEAHLKNCALCADDLAAYGFVRSAIADWKSSELDNLAVPAFTAFYSEKTEITKISWLEGVRSYFPFHVRLTFAASLAVLAVFATWGLFFYERTGEQTADGNFNQNTAVANANPDHQNNPAPDLFTAEKLENKEIDHNVSITNEETDQVSATEAPTTAKNKKPFKSSKQAENLKNQKPAKIQRKNKVTPRATKEPTLADSNAADEDDSLRLADIFEEISMR